MRRWRGLQQSGLLGRISAYPSCGSTYMRRFAAIAVLSLVFATPMFAQTPQGDANAGGPRRFQPPPDHWMTIDSLGQALGLTPAQRTKVTAAYTALNGVMKDAAARRQAIRQQMMASGGGGFT